MRTGSLCSSSAEVAFIWKCHCHISLATMLLNTRWSTTPSFSRKLERPVAAAAFGLETMVSQFEQSLCLGRRGLIRSGDLPVQLVLDVLASVGKRRDQAAPVFLELALDQWGGKVLGIFVYENLWVSAQCL